MSYTFLEKDLPTVTRAWPERSLPLATRPSPFWMPAASARNHRADTPSLNALYRQARVPRRGLLWQDLLDDSVDILAPMK